jgi:hypothetical protein
MASERDYVELGLSCADVSQVLDRGLNGRQLADLSQSVLGAIEQLTTCVGPAMAVLSYLLTNISIAEL